MKLLYKHFYKNPNPDHNTGDIWRDLPTFGLLKVPTCSGIVITPACDLANSKVETVTYLPIISLPQWFCSRSMYDMIRVEILNLIKQLQLDFDEKIFSKNYLPKKDSFSFIKAEIKTKEKSAKGKAAEPFNKLLLGLELLEKIISTECQELKKSELISFMGNKKIDELKTKIIKNSYSTDLHFLPSDEKNIDWSAISNHSVALFRYSITVPIEIFDLASDVDCTNWELSVDELGQRFPSIKEFKLKRPLKSLQLNTHFLSDLLTRYVSLYVRLGSPDFTQDMIEKIKTEM
jgi:hypothetical protein